MKQRKKFNINSKGQPMASGGHDNVKGPTDGRADRRLGTQSAGGQTAKRARPCDMRVRHERERALAKIQPFSFRNSARKLYDTLIRK